MNSAYSSRDFSIFCLPPIYVVELGVSPYFFMRNFSLFLVFLGFVMFASPVRAQTQTEMNATAGADLRSADAKLNGVYQKILSEKSDDKQFCTDLREAQRTWLKFVDLHLKTVFPLKDGQDPRVVYGSIYPLDYALTKTALIQQRTEQLQSLSSNSPQ